MKKTVLGMLVAGCLLSSSVGASALQSEAPPGVDEPAAYSRSVEGRAVKREYSLLRVASRSTESYQAVRVYRSSRELLVGRRINGEVYIPVRRFVEGVSTARATYNSASRTVTVSGGGYNISVSDGAYALYASGRVMFSATPSVLLDDGELYVPAKIAARAMSMSVYDGGDTLGLYGTAKPALSGDKYYREDEVYWLARIISAESRGESLIGQIAVGNTVLNRVRSPEFPNTIWSVIFDKKYGVQFSPVANGTIYNTPSSSALLAARICLEGFSVSDEVLYFLAPRAASSTWIEKNREYAFTIGGHDFFK